MANLAMAGNLVSNATVTGLTNINGGSDMILVVTSGGTGPCSTTPIAFYPAEFPTAKAYDRAFALLLVAQTSGKKVNIENYKNDSCNSGASYVLMQN